MVIIHYSQYTYSRFESLDTNLIFQGDGQAMQRPHDAAVLPKISIELLGTFDRLVNKYFGQAIRLIRMNELSTRIEQQANNVPADGRSPLSCRML